MNHFLWLIPLAFAIVLIIDVGFIPMPNHPSLGAIRGIRAALWMVGCLLSLAVVAIFEVLFLIGLLR